MGINRRQFTQATTVMLGSALVSDAFSLGRTQTGEHQSPVVGSFRDEFEDLALLQEFANVDRMRDFPRVVRRPDVRLDTTNPWDYTYHGEPYGWGWFPKLIHLLNGDLLCAYREDRAHVYSPAGRTVVVISSDGGITWSNPIVVAFVEGYTTGAERVIQTREGTVIIVGKSQHWNGKEPVNDPRNWNQFSYIARSKDNGRSWSPIERFTGPEGAMVNGVAQMSNGKLLWYGSTKNEKGEPVRATMSRHEAGGKVKWEVQPHPELGATSDEWSVAETRIAGTLVCLLRNQQYGEYYGTSRSYDYGKTWGPWRYSNLWIGGGPTFPTLRRLDNGLLVASYGERYNRRGFLAASHDDGLTWDVSHKISIIDSDEYCYRADTLYTDVAWAGGDRALAVNYVQTPSEQKLRGLYGTFVDVRYFNDHFRGIGLAQTGATVRKDTVGHWSFDEDEGDTVYDSTGKNYGQVYGAGRGPGRIGRALTLNGRDQYVVIKDSDTLRLPKWFTLEAWIRPDTIEGKQMIISKGFKYGFGLDAGRLFLQVGPGTARSNVTLTPGKWQHVAVTYAMRQAYSRATFYLDGVEQDWIAPDKYPTSQAEAQTVSDLRPVSGPEYEEYRIPGYSSTDYLVVGMNNDLKQGGFAGGIDEVAIHAGGSSQEQIQLSATRRFLSRGWLRSAILQKPVAAHWDRFQAEVRQPEGTRVAFSVLDEKGKVLRPAVQPGEDLSGISDSKICLQGELQSEDAGQSPLVWAWSVSLKGGLGIEPSFSEIPFESAPYQKMVKPEKGHKGPVY